MHRKIKSQISRMELSSRFSLTFCISDQNFYTTQDSWSELSSLPPMVSAFLMERKRLLRAKGVRPSSCEPAANLSLSFLNFISEKVLVSLFFSWWLWASRSVRSVSSRMCEVISLISRASMFLKRSKCLGPKLMNQLKVSCFFWFVSSSLDVAVTKGGTEGSLATGLGCGRRICFGLGVMGELAGLVMCWMQLNLCQFVGCGSSIF